MGVLMLGSSPTQKRVFLFQETKGSVWIHELTKASHNLLLLDYIFNFCLYITRKHLLVFFFFFFCCCFSTHNSLYTHTHKSLSLSLSLSLSIYIYMIDICSCWQYKLEQEKYTMEKGEEVPQPSSSTKSTRKFKRICVFCGSRTGYKSSFTDAALQLGKQLVEREIDLVYGGGSVGLMGLVSKTVFHGGCHVLGVIPKALMSEEISGGSVGELRIVADMHQRKAEMAKNADAFIALPGGYGTMEEVLEIIAWAQLGIHEKPVGMLNVDGYYDSLLALFDKGVEEGFIEDSARHIVVLSDSPHQLINKMEEYAAVHEGVASRQSWEVDQLVDSATTTTSGGAPIS